MKWPWQRKETPSPEMLELEESLRQTQLAIAQAYAGFNSAADQELVESYVYEIQALQARYSYLLRQRKALPPGGAPEGRERTRGNGQEKAGVPELAPRPVLPVA